MTADNKAAAGIIIYGTRFCPFCIRARQLLAQKQLPFTDIPVDGNPALRSRMEARSGRHTVPQIWIGDRHIGGFDDLWLFEQRGELDSLLSVEEFIAS